MQQLCAQSEQVPDPLKMLYAASQGNSPSAAQLARVLVAINDGSSKNFIVIDALDECKKDETDRERTAFFDVLGQLIDATATAYNIFITSRPEPDISTAMVKFAGIQLSVQGSGIADDIRSHIVAFVTNDARMKKWPQNVQDEVINDLSEKANGM